MAHILYFPAARRIFRTWQDHRGSPAWKDPKEKWEQLSKSRQRHKYSYAPEERNKDLW